MLKVEVVLAATDLVVKAAKPSKDKVKVKLPPEVLETVTWVTMVVVAEGVV
jgi:hypothetical protein